MAYESVVIKSTNNRINMHIISLVVAIAENDAIGKDNQMPWHLPADLKHFKNITTGGTVIMGRKTYESIGKALPNRENIVISRQKDYHLADAKTVNSLEEAIKISEGKELFIIGGAEIFKLAMSLAHRIYLTRIHQNFEADTFFPTINTDDWAEKDKEAHLPDEKNKYAYTFSTLNRK